MSRLTGNKKDSLTNYKVKKIDENWTVNIQNCINKLGKLEDLEEELGCPLEVVFKALKEGIYCVDYDNQEIRKFITPLCLNTTSKQLYWYGNNIGFPDLKDYKKTWWLKGERDD